MKCETAFTHDIVCVQTVHFLFPSGFLSNLYTCVNQTLYMRVFVGNLWGIWGELMNKTEPLMCVCVCVFGVLETFGLLVIKSEAHIRDF